MPQRTSAPLALQGRILKSVNVIPVEPVKLYVIVEELGDHVGNSTEGVLGVIRSSLTAPPPLSSPAAEAELALATDQPLVIVDEKPARGHGGTDLEAPLWKHDASEEGYVDAGKSVGIEGDL